MFARFENARHAALDTDLHLTAQDKNPLRRTRAMKAAAKTHGTPAQLEAA